MEMENNINESRRKFIEKSLVGGLILKIGRYYIIIIIINKNSS